MNAIEIAVRMETDAINFYREAVEKTKHPVGKKLFLTITEDEKRHLEMLSKIFRELDIEIKDVSPIKNIKTIFANTYFFLSDTGSWFMWEEHSIVDGGTPWA